MSQTIKPEPRALKFGLNRPSLTSNLPQTLSIFEGLIKSVAKRLTGAEVLAAQLASDNAYPASLRQLDITQQPTVEGSVLKSAVSVYFAYDPNNPPAAVDIYVTGLNSNTNPVFVARGQGTQSPITFSVTASGQQVTITAVTENAKGVKQPFADAISVGVTLNGSASAVAGTPTGAGPLGWAAAATTTDSTVNYGNYGYSGMASLPAGINTTYIYARWQGYIVPTKTGEYTIGTNFDDGANLYICGQTVGANDLATSSGMVGNLAYKNSAKILLTAGVYYPVVIEWQQQAGNYGLQLIWTPPNSAAQLIPSANLSTSATSVTGNLAGTWWNGSSGLWFPNGSGLIDPGNKTLFGAPANGGGINVVNSVKRVSSNAGSGSYTGADNSYVIPGWIVGQAYVSDSCCDIAIPSVSNSNVGYLFQVNGVSGNPLARIFKCSSFSALTVTAIGTGYLGNLGSNYTGWVNFAIYIGASGYMAFWVNNNLGADVTDLTYTPNTGINYGYQVSAGKIAPAPNASGAGSTALNPQGSIGTVSDYAFSYASTATTLTWSWGAFNVYCPDGSIYTVAASTGSAQTHSGASGTLSGTTPLEWTGLTASTTYHFLPYVTLNANGTATVSILCTGTSAATIAQKAQIGSGDGNVTCASSVDVAVATPASGSGGGSGGNPSCFSPNTKVKTERGDVAFNDLIPGKDKVLTARGTWRTVAFITSARWHGLMLDMGDGELSTFRHSVSDGGSWVRMMSLNRFPSVAYDGTIHNLHIECEPEDDGTKPNTEHSYTLSNGLVVHNSIPT